MYIVQTYRTYLGRLIPTAYLFPKLKLRNCPKHLTTKSLKFCQNIYIKLSPEIPQNCPRNCVQIIYNFTISQIPKSSLLTQILAGILEANPSTLKGHFSDFPTALALGLYCLSIQKKSNIRHWFSYLLQWILNTMEEFKIPIWLF